MNRGYNGGVMTWWQVLAFAGQVKLLFDQAKETGSLDAVVKGVKVGKRRWTVRIVATAAD